MENKAVSKYTSSFGISLALSSLINAALVIAKEKNPAVQATMQKLTGNHWVTHSAIVMVCFFVFGWLFANVRISVDRLVKIVVSGVLFAGLLIIGFYLIAD